MAEARNRQLWDHTAEVLSVLANGLLHGRHRSSEFHPYRSRDEEEPLGKVGPAFLAKVFLSQ